MYVWISKGFLQTYIHTYHSPRPAGHLFPGPCQPRTYISRLERPPLTQTTGAGAEKRLLPILALVLGPSGGAMA